MPCHAMSLRIPTTTLTSWNPSTVPTKRESLYRQRLSNRCRFADLSTHHECRADEVLSDGTKKSKKKEESQTVAMKPKLFCFPIAGPVYTLSVLGATAIVKRSNPVKTWHSTRRKPPSLAKQ